MGAPVQYARPRVTAVTYLCVSHPGSQPAFVIHYASRLEKYNKACPGMRSVLEEYQARPRHGMPVRPAWMTKRSMSAALNDFRPDAPNTI